MTSVLKKEIELSTQGLQRQQQLALQKEKLNKGRKGKKFVRYTDKQKITALKAYQATGSLREASAASGIGYDYLRQVTTTDWWKKSIQEFQEAADNQLDSQLTEIINESVSALKDRVVNGDYSWNSATQMFQRKQLPAKDLAKITETMMKQRFTHREKPAELATQATIQDQLQRIANALSNNTPLKRGEVIDVNFTMKEEDEPTLSTLSTTSSPTSSAAYTAALENSDG
jgi:GTPase involved in cell partitioning and DNA repair